MAGDDVKLGRRMQLDGSLLFLVRFGLVFVILQRQLSVATVATQHKVTQRPCLRGEVEKARSESVSKLNSRCPTTSKADVLLDRLTFFFQAVCSNGGDFMRYPCLAMLDIVLEQI